MKHRKRVIFSPGAGTRKIEAERWNEIKRDTICLSKSNAAATLICRPFPFKSRRSSRIDPFALKRNQTEAEKSSRKSEWTGGKGKIRWKIKKGREKKRERVQTPCDVRHDRRNCLQTSNAIDLSLFERGKNIMTMIFILPYQNSITKFYVNLIREDR